MDTTFPPDLMRDDNDTISATVLRESSKLGSFIRSRVSDPMDAENVLQDVFEQFVESYRLPGPIEQAGAWLLRVARNRIVDLFRRKKDDALDDIQGDSDAEGACRLDLTLPSPDGGPEAAYARSVLLDALQQALAELPANQRDVFVAHELENRSFKDMALNSGVPLNTLLARKRYAVLHLRSRLQTIYDELDL